MTFEVGGSGHRRGAHASHVPGVDRVEVAEHLILELQIGAAQGALLHLGRVRVLERPGERRVAEVPRLGADAPGRRPSAPTTTRVPGPPAPGPGPTRASSRSAPPAHRRPARRARRARGRPEPRSPDARPGWAARTSPGPAPANRTSRFHRPGKRLLRPATGPVGSAVRGQDCRFGGHPFFLIVNQHPERSLAGPAPARERT